MRTLCRTFLIFVTVIAVAVLASVAAGGQAFSAPEHFTAFAAQTGPDRTWTGSVSILITRWSTSAERDRLMAVLLGNGPEALLDALRDHQPVGTLRMPNSLRQDLRLAWTEPMTNGGRNVTVLTDRPIGFWEAAMRPRSIDYPFTIIEMQIDRDGDGEGQMWIAARITVDKTWDHVELEDYASEPVRLMSIHSSRLTH